MGSDDDDDDVTLLMTSLFRDVCSFHPNRLGFLFTKEILKGEIQVLGGES